MTNSPTAIVIHNGKLEKLQAMAELLYNAPPSQMHNTHKMLHLEAQEAMCDLLAHQSHTSRRETNCQAMRDEIKKQRETIIRSTKTQKAVLLGEIYNKAVKTELQKAEEFKRKNPKPSWGRGDHTAQSETPDAPYHQGRGRGGGRGRASRGAPGAL